jgi:hypothetical protein
LTYLHTPSKPHPFARAQVRTLLSKTLNELEVIGMFTGWEVNYAAKVEEIMEERYAQVISPLLL